MIPREERRVFLGMPSYGEITAAAGRAFWRATRLPDSQVFYQQNEGSLLAANFNTLWCSALNRVRAGERVDYFAMQHGDVEPQDWWLDTLIDELESRDLDILGVVVPIKDMRGITSIALAHETGDPWRLHARLTMHEVFRLPETFTSEDVGRPLLLNTGLWVCRFNPEWARKVWFTINDRIVIDPEGRYIPQTESEDWFFSRLLHELGLKIGCTRKITLKHRGGMSFPNDQAWGTQPVDTAHVSESVVPETDRDGFRFPYDVEGWLRPEEGKALWNLARGKRVLEIGSYCGLSTVCIASSAESVVSVDPHDGRGTAVQQNTLARFKENLERYGVSEKVFSIVGTIQADTLSGGDDEFDLIFIDGAHDYESVRNDIACALEIVAPGGLLAFHDYRSPIDPGVAQAVDELLAAGGELLSTHATLAVVRPPAAVPLEV
jgi:predicted O-methyltransferase YrrM